MEEKIVNRFFKYVDTDGRKNNNMSKCWRWKACKNYGYGQLSINGGKVKAHRFSYEYYHPMTKPLSETGFCVCHKCDNPECCNPAHLFVGTHLENNRDKKAKGRCYRPTGEKHPLAKLTENQVMTIAHRYKNEKITQIQLAREYNISTVQIYRIVKGLRWSYLQLAPSPATDPSSQTDIPH